jgi:hypothetical protein
MLCSAGSEFGPKCRSRFTIEAQAFDLATAQAAVSHDCPHAITASQAVASFGRVSPLPAVRQPIGYDLG